MTAPAGPCEWCGGPHWWTIVQDEMYVKCVAGCLPLPFEGEVLSSPISDPELIGPIVKRVMEQVEAERVYPVKAGTQTRVVETEDELPF